MNDLYYEVLIGDDQRLKFNYCNDNSPLFVT